MKVSGMRPAIQLLVALIFSMLISLLIPFCGWLFGWYGVAVDIGAGALAAYLYGLWIAKQGVAIKMWVWCLSVSIPPFIFFAWRICTHISDPVGWAWLCAGITTYAGVFIALRTQGSSHETK